MKRQLHTTKFAVSILLLLAVVGVAKAQTKTWPMPGAEWTYCLYADGDAYAKEVWQVTNDTLIGNRIYNIIQPVDSFGHPIANSGKILLTRCENNIVFRYVNNQEYLFFPLDLEEGDVFTTFRSAGWGANSVLNYGNDSTCCSLKPLSVTGKKEVELGGLVLNEYTLKDTLFSSLYGYEDLGYWRMVDRIGPIDTYPLIDLRENGGVYNGQGFCNYIVCGYTSAILSAYHDDGFEYVWFECNPTSVAENSAEEKIEIYPNPTSGIINIEGKEVAEVQVYNSFGQLAKTFQNTNVIDLEPLPKGIYVLVITNNKNIKRTTKIMIN